MGDKLPAIQFYPGDWFKDPSLASVSAATRGVWIDLLLRMFENDRCGFVEGNLVQLSRLARCTEEEMRRAVDEIEETKLGDVTKCHTKVTIINRRMHREWVKRKDAAKRKVKQRSGGVEETPPQATSQKSHTKVTTLSSSSSSTSVAPASAGACPEAAQPPRGPTTKPTLFDESKLDADEPGFEGSKPAPDEPPIRPPVLVYPTVGKTHSWPLTQSALDSLAGAFPALDALDECRRALAWLEANPTNRKTAVGMNRFLFAWLTRSNDSRGSVSRNGALPTLDPRGNFAAAKRYLDAVGDEPL